MSVELAIIAAMEREIRPMVRGWQRRQLVSGEFVFPVFTKDAVLVVCSGIGGTLARRAAVAVTSAERPRLMVSAGFAGALNSQLEVGQIFLPTTVVDVGTGARYDAGGSEGVLVSASSVLDRDAKRRITGSFAAQAVDMEAAAVALVAGQHRCRFMAVKAISEEADFQMPSFDGLIDARGHIRTARFLAAFAIRPARWALLARLARNTARASRELSRALAHLIRKQGGVLEPSLSVKRS